MTPGEKCICQHDEGWNAYGDANEELKRGMRLTVKARHHVAGQVFYEFDETREGHKFWSAGFKPMRQLN